MTNKNEQEIALHYSGTFEKNHTLTARTVGHGLSNLQRMIDKAVLFAKKGGLKKGDALPTIWYPEADIQVQNFKKGCVTIPFVGPSNPEVISLLKGVLHDPYNEAISDDLIEKATILESYENAFNRAVHKIEVRSHADLISNISEFNKKYFAESILRDFDNLISPLRSSKSKNTDLISVDLKNNEGLKEFEFDKETSRRFHKIVSMKQLGPVISFTGRLTGLEESRSKDFPYKGTFYSSASKNEHKLLIRNEIGVNELRQFVAAKKLKLSILACPIIAWGTFDLQKGDLVYMKMSAEG